MPNDKTLKHQAIIRKTVFCLPAHFQNRRFGALGVIGRGGILFRGGRGGVFEIRQVNVYKPLKRFQAFHRIISAGVVNDGHGRLVSAQNINQKRRKMCGVHQIDVVRALAFELLHDFNEPFAAHGFADPAVADFLILTKDTAKRTTRKENRTRAVFAADRRFFPLVERCAREHGVIGHFAKAQRRRVFRAFCAAVPRASKAYHFIASQKLKLSVFEIQRQSASNSSKQKPTSCGVCASEAVTSATPLRLNASKSSFSGPNGAPVLL